MMMIDEHEADDLLDQLDRDFELGTAEEVTEPDHYGPALPGLPGWESLSVGSDDEAAPEIVEALRLAAVAWVHGEDEGTVTESQVLGDHVVAVARPRNAREVRLRRLVQQCATGSCLDLERVRTRFDLLDHVRLHHLGDPLPTWVPAALGLGIVAAGGAAGAGEATSHEPERRPVHGVVVAPALHLTWLRERFGGGLFTTSDVLAVAHARPEGSGLDRLGPGPMAQKLGTAYRTMRRSHDGELQIGAVGFTHGGARLWRVSDDG